MLVAAWAQVRASLLGVVSRIRGAVPQAATTSPDGFGASPAYARLADIIARHAATLERALGGR